MKPELALKFNDIKFNDILTSAELVFVRPYSSDNTVFSHLIEEAHFSFFIPKDFFNFVVKVVYLAFLGCSQSAIAADCFIINSTQHTRIAL